MSRRSDYALAQPPRRVPWLVRSQVLFGGFMNQFGWLFFGFGLIFVWIFGLNADLSSLLIPLRTMETAEGMVLRVEETSATVNETPVYAYTYIFRVESLEQEFQGTSYSTGRQFEPGWIVTIEYARSNPEVSRIHGMRQAIFGPWVLCLVFIFPLIGLVFIIVGLRNGFKANRLLANGQIAWGQLKAKEPTSTTVNDQPVYKLTFEFQADDGGIYEVVAKTHLPHLLEDEAEEQVLYNPRRPAYAVLLDQLPGSPDLDELGYIHPASLRSGVLPLLLPGLTLLIHGTAFLLAVL